MGRSRLRTGWKQRRQWLSVGLGIVALLLVLISPGMAQLAPVSDTLKAPVVVDGQVLFQIGNSGNLTADERAEIINDALRQEVRSPDAVNIEVVSENELVVIRSVTSNRNLITVTQSDITTGTSPASQARIWRRLIESALRQGQLARTPIYVRQALIVSLIVVVGAIAVHIVSSLTGKWLSRHLNQWLGQPTAFFTPREQSARLFLQLALIGIQAGLWTAVGLYVSDLFPEARSLRYELFQFLNAPVISLGDSTYSALQLLLLLAFTVGLWFAVSLLTQIFRFYVLDKTGAEQRVQEVIAVITQYTLVFLGLIVLLQIWGLDVGSLAIIASVLGVGIGFGLQNITNNFISGLIITLERPIQVGDFIQVKDWMGIVERIGARSTEIRTLDQITIIVPNSRFLESEVINWSHSDPVSRLHIPVGVAFESDVQTVKAALLEAARSHPDVLVRPEPQVWFKQFGDSALQFDLLVWTGEPKDQFPIKSDLYYRIEASLRRYGIQVPYPQRDLHLRSPELHDFLNAWGHGPSPTRSGAIPSRSANGADLVSTEPSKQIPLTDLHALAARMQSPDGVTIKDRSYRMNSYPACFTGAEAVEWLVETQGCSRQEAIIQGQQLVEQGFIHHVSEDYPFQDGYVFYRFRAEVERSPADLHNQNEEH